jgi:hypothetical protein
MDDWFADDGSTLAEELAARIKPELAPGERLLWAARSRSELSSGPISLANWLCIVVSGLVAFLGIGTGLGMFGQTLKDSSSVAIMLGDLAVPFFLGSCAFAVHAWVTNLGWGQEKPATIYALTDSRAIVWRPEPKRGGFEIFTLPPGSFRQVHRHERPDGSGDVTFSHLEGFSGMPEPPKGFQGVADVARVEALIRAGLLVKPTEGPPTVELPPFGLRRREAGQVDAGGG